MDKNNLCTLFNIIFSDDSTSDKDNDGLKPVKRKKKFWVHPYFKDRNSSGAFANIFDSLRDVDDEILFMKYMRMKSTQFEELLLLVGPLIEKETVVREPISAAMRLVITLRYILCNQILHKCSYLLIIF